MTLETIRNIFESEFDKVGYINASTYNVSAKRLGRQLISNDKQTLFVLAYAYPKRLIKQTNTYLVPSFYTFGQDYHTIIKAKIMNICQNIPYKYEFGVDNHPLDERLMAELTGIGYQGKNQLIINKHLGTYFFLAYVLIDIETSKPHTHQIIDNCGDCHKCIDSCPTNALSEEGYLMERCISYYNQEKIPLTIDKIKANYQLFGCDICQLVCPKNINKGIITHSEFNLSGKEKVDIHDLFFLSQKAFKKKYENMAYLWKGKTILMRNAAMVMLNQKNTSYISEIEASLKTYTMPWYQTTIKTILNQLKKIELM